MQIRLFSPIALLIAFSMALVDSLLLALHILPALAFVIVVVVLRNINIRV